METKEQKEERCDCGRLLFKMTSRGLEFKCNRCKHIHFVPLDRLDKEFHSLCPVIDQTKQNSWDSRSWIQSPYKIGIDDDVHQRDSRSNYITHSM